MDKKKGTNRALGVTFYNLTKWPENELLWPRSTRATIHKTLPSKRLLMKPASAEKRRRIFLLTLVCIVILVVTGLLTRNAQVALFLALLVQVIGVFIIAPWKQ